MERARGSRAPLVALCGTSTATAAEDLIAAQVGHLLAERGATIVCGGLSGIMSSGARGAAENGGTVIGLLPGTEAADANEFITVAVPTGLGEMRNGLIARSCEGMVAIGGGYGTLSEIAFMRRLGRPVTCLASWGISLPGTSEPDPGIHWAQTPQDAVAWLFEQMVSEAVSHV